jgi:hypothetical protein
MNAERRIQNAESRIAVALRARLFSKFFILRSAFCIHPESLNDDRRTPAALHRLYVVKYFA